MPSQEVGQKRNVRYSLNSRKRNRSDSKQSKQTRRNSKVNKRTRTTQKAQRRSPAKRSPNAHNAHKMMLTAGQRQAPNVDSLYLFLVNYYKTAAKDSFLEKLNQVMTRYKQAQDFDSIDRLKEKLDVSFSKDVGCQYSYFASTPNSYGCDLRELIFNRDGSTTAQGEALLETFADVARMSAEKGKSKLFHVVTDIDDTLYANHMHHTYVAGSDDSWIQHTPYPGVAALHQQLHTLDNATSYTTVLSGTPGPLKSKKLHSAALHDILGKNFAFIQGIESKRDIFSLGPSILATAWNKGINPDGEFYKKLATTKFMRFKQYAKIFPERRFIWIGDNGQGDEVVGRWMLQQKDVSVTVCIHTIRPSDPAEQIIYFKSYTELARKLVQKGIIKRKHVKVVKRSAASECAAAVAATSLQRQIHCTK